MGKPIVKRQETKFNVLAMFRRKIENVQNYFNDKYHKKKIIIRQRYTCIESNKT